MELKDIVPWGRSFNEYKEMFSLNTDDLDKRILGCGDGPASFNAELTKSGGHVISADPLYEFSGKQIRARIKEVYPVIMAEAVKNIHDYIWKSIANTKELGKTRMNAMEKFLNDYDKGKESGRYITASLPVLPFKDQEFDLALCSHYLFLYSDHVNKTEHILSVKELCRVAKEVRIYPLLSLKGVKSEHLDLVIQSLKKKSIEVSLERVNYQFQKGATEMLVVESTK
jgi:hypothetical protein